MNTYEYIPNIYSPPVQDHICWVYPLHIQEINIIGKIIGKNGKYFKWFTEESGVTYIWFNSNTQVIEIWAHYCLPFYHIEYLNYMLTCHIYQCRNQQLSN